MYLLSPQQQTDDSPADTVKIWCGIGVRNPKIAWKKGFQRARINRFHYPPLFFFMEASERIERGKKDEEQEERIEECCNKVCWMQDRLVHRLSCWEPTGGTEFRRHGSVTDAKTEACDLLLLQ